MHPIFTANFSAGFSKVCLSAARVFTAHNASDQAQV